MLAYLENLYYVVIFEFWSESPSVESEERFP